MNILKVAAVCGLIASSACSIPNPSNSTGTYLSLPLGSNVSKSVAISEREIKLTDSGKFVSVHAERRLFVSDQCVEMVTTSTQTSYGFDKTIIALRNRASVVGGNAISVTGWATSGNNAIVVAKYYNCASKSGL